MSSAALAAVVAATMTAAGIQSAQAQDAAPVKGGVLRVGLAAEPEALDPATIRTVAGWEAMMPMCQGLYHIGPDGLPAPQLAVGEPTVSEEGRVVEIRLKTDGVRFNDGEPFTPQAAKAAFDRTLFEIGGGVSALAQYVESIEATGDSLIFRLKSAYAPLTTDLAGPSGMIASPAQVQKLGKDLGQHPVCVGPYEFASRTSGSEIVLKASSHYHDPSAVHFDQISFRIVTDENARLLGIRSGDLDIIENPPITELGRLESEGLKITKFIGLGWTGLNINVGNTDGAGKPPVVREHPVSKHPEIREAISLALDRNALNALLSRGQSNAGCSVISPSDPMYSEVPCPGRDVEAAKALIAGTGVALPIGMTVIANRDVRALEAIQAMVKEIGIEITIDACDTSTCFNRFTKGEADAYFTTWSGLPDVDTLMSALFGASSALNGTQPLDPRIDELLKAGRVENDPAARKAIYAEFAERLASEKVAVSIGNPAVAVVSGAKLGGIGFSAPGKLDVSGSYFTE